MRIDMSRNMSSIAVAGEHYEVRYHDTPTGRAAAYRAIRRWEENPELNFDIVDSADLIRGIVLAAEDFS